MLYIHIFQQYNVGNETKEKSNATKSQMAISRIEKILGYFNNTIVSKMDRIV